MMNYIISNNKFISSDEFKLDIEDGLLYGYGVFETILLKEKKLIYLEEHYNRLIKAVNRLKINMDISFEKLSLYLNLYIQKNSLENSILRVTVLKNSETFDILVTHRENKYKSLKYREGFKMEISEFKRNPNSIISGIKSVNYLENIYALREAKAIGSDEVLFLDCKNYISEGATSNIFFIKDGVIHTPTKECGLLKGIIREKIIEIIDRNKHLELKQGFFSLKKLLEADEVFLTNSIIGIMPVSKIDHTIYDLKKYNITDLLAEELRKN
ncbi:MAG: aminotransferase class IV [Psychrilyobacter sp.]|uniref:aminotransferase class IV n=1 Tax=Psychrilyobacter sp. TaxID=2586924 RepID=UPI003C7708D8